MPLHRVERQARREADSPVIGSECVRVLDAVALEEPVLPVVHLDGKLDHHLALRLREDDLLVVREPHEFGRGEQLLRRRVEEVPRLRRDADLLEDPRGG
jgi:hypothetical protein